MPGRPSPPGLVSNPTAQLYLHPPGCASGLAALDSCSRFPLNCESSYFGICTGLHETLSHTHTLSQVVLAKALSCIMFFVQIRKPRLRKAC